MSARPSYERPDYEPAPKQDAAPNTPAAAGFIQGQPFEAVVVRPGWRGILDRLKRSHQQQAAHNTCGNCGTSTPGYSWCSSACAEQWERENPL